jgi:hypothetical protein
MIINDTLNLQSTLIQTMTTVTSTATLTIDKSLVKVANGATNITINMPLATGSNGVNMYIGRAVNSTGTITINAAVGEQIEALAGSLGTSTSLATIGVYGGRVVFLSDGTNWVRKING